MKVRTIAALVTGTLLLMLFSVALAAPDALTVPWWTVDGGGGVSTGGGFRLSGTIGQAEAGVRMSGGSYSVVGGFWGGAVETPTTLSYIYLPLVLR